MRISRSLIKFAFGFCFFVVALALSACKGRTMENMEPNGETVEVVIEQDTTVNI